MNQNLKSLSIGHQWASTYVGEGAYPYIVMASAMTFWTMVSIIPLYNKFFFKKTLYPYPIASAGIQLSLVSVLLAIINITHHYIRTYFRKNSRVSIVDIEEELEEKEVSWIFGRHLLWKLKWTAPIGILFGLKYGVTNLGLFLLPAPTHLLLQSTDLVWTLLAAWIINKERVTKFELGCLLGCVAGSVLQSFHVGETIEAPFFALLVNLLSPIFLALCVSTLRLACTELMRLDNRVSGTMGSVEVSSIKLSMSGATALILASLMEPTWFTAFLHLPTSVKLGIAGGSIPILIFQVNCTFLAYLTSAVVVGLAGQVKVIPQWISAALFASKSMQWDILNELGAALIILSAASFAMINWLRYNQNSITFVVSECCNPHTREYNELDGLLDVEKSYDKQSYSSTDEESSEEGIRS